MSKLDLVAANPVAYRARSNPRLVEPEPGRFLIVDGQGAPEVEGGDFSLAMGALYGVAWTLKFMHKAREQDFKVAPPESWWWIDSDDRAAWRTAPRSQWCWRAAIRVPSFVTDEDLAEAREQLAARGKEGRFELVELADVDEGECVQVLHKGPYADEEPTISAMHAWVAEQGLSLRGPHHEVYLSDPKRTKPERLKTILRHGVSKA